MRPLPVHCFVLLLVLETVRGVAAAQPVWKRLGPGVEWTELPSPLPSTQGDSRFTIARVDPSQQPVELFSAEALHLPGNLTPDGWAEKYGLLAVINAGMFQKDDRLPVGYAKVDGQVLNAHWKPSYQAVFVSDPIDANLPRSRLLDADCDGDVKALAARYRTVLQSLRMIDCHGTNVWKPQPKQWSTAALASDDQGRLLFIHARSPYRVYDFDEILLKLPLKVTRAMYLEGGPEASLHLVTPDGPQRRMGLELGFFGNSYNTRYWELPNVFAVRKPKKSEGAEKSVPPKPAR